MRRKFGDDGEFRDEGNEDFVVQGRIGKMGKWGKQINNEPILMSGINHLALAILIIDAESI